MGDYVNLSIDLQARPRQPAAAGRRLHPDQPGCRISRSTSLVDLKTLCAGVTATLQTCLRTPPDLAACASSPKFLFDNVCAAVKAALRRPAEPHGGSRRQGCPVQRRGQPDQRPARQRAGRRRSQPAGAGGRGPGQLDVARVRRDLRHRPGRPLLRGHRGEVPGKERVPVITRRTRIQLVHLRADHPARREFTSAPATPTSTGSSSTATTPWSRTTPTPAASSPARR
ncbi:hypothetical protein G5V59_13640 [Nocardioides sp. W3-2-3]|uniref:hypothetical protein n=1 Tax=Nocardioides convexus TaxID=2712224 RepID=UPI0024182478|nr:hypothetical protein [Nocardioides convexus]NHA00699.1 hypothetical protein [Nocardioides convexus]